MPLTQKKLFQNYSSFPINSKIVNTAIGFLSSVIRTKMLNINATRGPLFITWLCTYRCNANCKFCSTHEMNKRYPETLSLKRAKEIAHEIGKAKTRVVGFTGGEVFLWPYLFNIIKILKQYDITVYIITNGLLLKDNAQNILETNVDTIVVSLDSDNALEHDDNRNMPGIYSSAIEGIEYLKEKRKNKHPLIKTTTVFSKKTYPKIKQIIGHLSKIADAASIQPIATGYVYNPHNIKQEEKKSFNLDQKEESSVIKSLKELTKIYPCFNNFYFNNIPTYLFHPEKLLKIKCWSPFLRLQIMPQGKVVHCIANPRYSTVGDLNRMSLMEAWNGPEIKHHREEIRKHKNNCICWSQDSSFNAFLHNIPLLNKLPTLKRWGILK